MKTIKKISAIICFCILANGCTKSFLDRSPISNANAVNYYKTQADFEIAMNSTYATLYTVYAPEAAVSYTELLGDNATLYSVAGNQADKWAFRDYTIESSNTLVYQFWQENYKAIFNVNTVLDKIQVAGLDETFSNRVKAEMMFLRGLYYYNMVQLFGDLPLVTKVLTAEESYGVLRSPIAQVYTQIVNDLSFAVNNLPVASGVTVVGRASKGAAQTLLGKVYLSMGNKSTAAEVLQEVYKSKQYNLLPSTPPFLAPM